MRYKAPAIALFCLLACTTCLCRSEPPRFSHQQLIPFAGEVTDSGNLSGIALVNDMIAICADEVAAFDLLERDGDRLRVVSTIKLGPDGTEIDLEGMAAVDNVLYVVGSHSLSRKNVDAGKTYEQNRERLLELNDDKHRRRLFRLTFDAEGKVTSQEHINLRKTLRDDEVLGPFTAIPSKENGVDIEGIAARGKHLYVGFRGPVLRGNYVPVMTFKFDDFDDYRLLYLDLHGDGVRDMAAVSDGFLILAGPVGDTRAEFSLYHWNGKDCLIGHDSPGGKCRLVGQIETVGKGKAEGLAVKEAADSYELLVVFDGVDDGVYRFFVPKPR